ncbi:hypothetical protein CEUSTIGMA_g9271.t1 [Chlamydomonas eustigma]|uniref:Protein kinase domain-containing protein n=1 Tax=Chlamydomonas eustigma TaxID=1157962 RepID=A0A250XFL0_9CHLO|nr:hypothetical protein CEUSTIGMA_g9271.t1 [Chlamydomonas eustigma]|eukprot:GAX81843.1 hypothetical protein CEUSTIGMA_g9271.t1 [Chlamydomonas eustigma]
MLRMFDLNSTVEYVKGSEVEEPAFYSGKFFEGQHKRSFMLDEYGDKFTCSQHPFTICGPLGEGSLSLAPPGNSSVNTPASSEIRFATGRQSTRQMQQSAPDDDDYSFVPLPLDFDDITNHRCSESSQRAIRDKNSTSFLMDSSELQSGLSGPSQNNKPSGTTWTAEPSRAGMYPVPVVRALSNLNPHNVSASANLPSSEHGGSLPRKHYGSSSSPSVVIKQNWTQINSKQSQDPSLHMLHNKAHDASLRFLIPATTTAGARSSSSRHTKSKDSTRSVGKLSIRTFDDVSGIGGSVRVSIVIQQSDLSHVKTLGHGSFGVVEQCFFKPQHRMVAVKRLRPEFVKNKEDVESLRSEIALLRRLFHENIIEYIGYGSKDVSSEETADKTMFLVQEYIDGGTLKSLVSRQMKDTRGKLKYSTQDAVRWMLYIACGLQYLHSRHPMVIHRDLKLENILLKGKDPATLRPKIADFGMSALVSRTFENAVRPEDQQGSSSFANLSMDSTYAAIAAAEMNSLVQYSILNLSTGPSAVAAKDIPLGKSPPLGFPDLPSNPAAGPHSPVSAECNNNPSLRLPLPPFTSNNQQIADGNRSAADTSAAGANSMLTRIPSGERADAWMQNARLRRISRTNEGVHRPALAATPVRPAVRSNDDPERSNVSCISEEMDGEGSTMDMRDLKVSSPERQLSGRTGTLMYMAPEVYLRQPYDDKADVFSFGIMAYEVLHRYQMVSATDGSLEECQAYARRVATSGFRPPIDPDLPESLGSLLKSCWQADAHARPSMDHVVSRLKDILAREDWVACEKKFMPIKLVSPKQGVVACCHIC